MNTADSEPPNGVVPEGYYDPKTPVGVTFPLHEAMGLLLFYEAKMDAEVLLVSADGINYTLSAHYSIARMLEAMGATCGVDDWRMEAAGLRAAIDQVAARYS